MQYEGMVYRPPSEGDSVIIQATIGCPHNRCRFCNMFKEKRFRARKIEEILDDIDRAGQIYDPRFVRTLFLADGNTVFMRTELLLRALERIREVFPHLERVTSYGSSRFMAQKPPGEWKELREAGLSRIHCGMESGHDPLLKKVAKGCTMADHIKAGQAVRAAGIELSMYFMAGLGGMEMSEGHARDSARVLNDVNPDFIRIRTFAPSEGTPMGDEFRAGELSVMEPHDILCANCAFWWSPWM
ncbi:coproporphyrinogen III oxidase [Alphaproteobacteria bacterium]|nr:coproporphyrinogen III oxidase [Alphaproteobacteria bacterium]